MFACSWKVYEKQVKDNLQKKCVKKRGSNLKSLKPLDFSCGPIPMESGHSLYLDSHQLKSVNYLALNKLINIDSYKKSPATKCQALKGGPIPIESGHPLYLDSHQLKSVNYLALNKLINIDSYKKARQQSARL
jgi:hypothetical protein